MMRRAERLRNKRAVAVFVLYALTLFAFPAGGTACAKPEFNNLMDVTDSSGLAVLAGLLGTGVGAGARLGYSWELINTNVGAHVNSVAVVYQDRLWLYGGRDAFGLVRPSGQVSGDGVTFETPTVAPVIFDETVFGQPAALVYNGEIYLAVHTIENNGDSRLRISSSTDGLNFTPRFNYLYPAPNTIGEPALVVYHGRLFAYDFGQAFYSDDGSAWTNAGSTGVDAPGGPETNHGAAVIADWIVREYENWLLISSDGINFSVAITGVEGSKFKEHLVFDGRLFSVIEWQRRSIVFETRDLLTRTTISPLNTVCCQWSPLYAGEDYAAIVFRDRMRFYGGRSIDSLEVYGAWFSLGGGSGRDGATHTDFSK